MPYSRPNRNFHANSAFLRFYFVYLENFRLFTRLPEDTVNLLEYKPKYLTSRSRRLKNRHIEEHNNEIYRNVFLVAEPEYQGQGRGEEEKGRKTRA
jgi:hypothetical protein